MTMTTQEKVDTFDALMAHFEWVTLDPTSEEEPCTLWRNRHDAMAEVADLIQRRAAGRWPSEMDDVSWGIYIPCGSVKRIDEYYGKWGYELDERDDLPPTLRGNKRDATEV